MPRIPIDDLDDPRIAVYRSLKSTNLTRNVGQFVVEGERLVERLVESRFPVVSVLVGGRHATRLTVVVPEDVPTFVVSDAMVDAIVGFPFHRGVLAGLRLAGSLAFLAEVDSPPTAGPLHAGRLPQARVIPRIWERSRGSATCSGSTRSWPVQKLPRPASRRVLRVSMGSAAWNLPVIVVDRGLEETAGSSWPPSLAWSFWAAVADPAGGFLRAGSPDPIVLPWSWATKTRASSLTG